MTNTTKPELKPCPFCGGEATLADGEAGTDGLSIKARNPRCRSCGVDMGYCSDSITATIAWNTRPPQWQPIETAPNDGTGFTGYQRMDSDHWIIASMYFHDGEFKMVEFNEDNFENSYAPSHWMPLPSCPE